MRFVSPSILCLVLVVLTAGPARAQEPVADRVPVPLSDPGRPVTLKVHLIEGGITVKGSDTKEVIVEARPRVSRRRERSSEKTEGMTRLVIAGTGLSVTEEHNVVDVSAMSHSRAVDLVISVPVKTSVKLGCVNSGDITVENVSGELEVNNVNGSVTLTGVSGSAVAHALNGNVTAVFREVTPAKAMSFSSMNGKIDVSFPAGLKANVVVKSDNGDVLSDFDIRLDQSARKPIVEDGRDKGGKYRVRIDKAVYGTINGGGAEIKFQNFNGNIYIRKATK
ncbi:MAG: hypothetical protein DMG07_12635 [Acidobacteria bacterium]|nr:MAG: hypothetical protein DMG07_12635 [Acidobacteriota bacterium]